LRYEKALAEESLNKSKAELNDLNSKYAQVLKESKSMEEEAKAAKTKITQLEDTLAKKVHLSTSHHIITSYHITLNEKNSINNFPHAYLFIYINYWFRRAHVPLYFHVDLSFFSSSFFH
jgi:hypothetical protein